MLLIIMLVVPAVIVRGVKVDVQGLGWFPDTKLMKALNQNLDMQISGNERNLATSIAFSEAASIVRPKNFETDGDRIKSSQITDSSRYYDGRHGEVLQALSGA